MKPNKYRNKRVWMCEQGHGAIPGQEKCDVCPSGIIHFDSKKEAGRWSELKLLERAGEISDLRRQVRYPLCAYGAWGETFWHPVKIRSGRYANGRQASYVADFVYTENSEQIIEDVKGMITPVAKLKIAIVEAMLGTQVKIT